MLTRHPDLGEPSAPPPPETFPRAPRQRWATVAVFVCPETERLGREAGFPVAVLAAMAEPELHAAWLSSTRYAAWSPRSYDSWPLPFDDGLATPRDLAYRQLRFDRRWLGATGLSATPMAFIVKSSAMSWPTSRKPESRLRCSSSTS